MQPSARLLLCAALCTISGAVAAQSSVTLYGIIDTGIEYVSHANAAGKSVFRMPSVTGEMPSRWGLRGAEDLGGGYSAIFTLESGFNVRAGDLGQGGRLFGRQAFVGIKSPYGTISFGRQYTMTYLALMGADLIGPDIYGLGSLDAYVPNGRADNSVVYLGSYAGVTFGANYSFGRDAAGTGNSPGQGTCTGSVAGQTTQCREWSVMLKYDAPLFGVAGSYEEQRGGSTAAANFFDGITPTPLTSAADKDIRTQLSAYAKFGKTKLGVGWLNRRVEPGADTVASVRSNLFFLAAAYNVTPAFIVDGEVYHITNTQHDTRATMGTLRTTYLLSKRTAVYAQASYLANSAKAQYSVSGGGGGTTPAAGTGQTGVMVGMRHSF
ncbi:membrane protein [Robbsia andropogonis]|uniref:Membrane protein n=1 Tax=Robbsia andropogonis TaxID=28092 RepID=A0A0F5JWC7_9BURK|nr:porin [Robbsia andropogonis]KKB61969.1 membrane protein [Robbsia andropogonis]MCP1121575.1 porin [Robbsia andropogonis]MCP1131391.1 porin [Robbsia andropogonis]